VLGMCEKCVVLDRKIEHYERIRFLLGDPVTADRVKELIAELHAQKQSNHPT